MHAVALAPGGRVGDLDAVVASVARDLGRSHAEVRQRMALAGEDPVVIGVQRDANIAEATAAMLCAHGFVALALAVHEPVAGLVVARSFELDTDRLRVVGREHDHVEFALEDVYAIVLGRRFETAPTPREAPEPPRTALGNRMADQVFRSYTQPKTRAPAPSHEHIAYVFTPSHAAALREHELLYQSLGAELLPSRGANFRLVVQHLRERCTLATCDDRLLRPGAQSHILGPMVAVDGHLALAATLVASTMPRPAHNPYR